MAETKNFSIHWVVSNICRAKASIKYKIKQTEGLLKLELSQAENDVLVSELLKLSSLLCKHYADYLEVLGIEPNASNAIDTFHSWRDCYNHIQVTKPELQQAITLEEETRVVISLKNNYLRLGDLLSNMASAKPKLTTQSKEIMKEPELPTVYLKSPPKFTSVLQNPKYQNEKLEQLFNFLESE